MLFFASTTQSGSVVSNDVQLTVHEALSGIFASISLSAWIFFLVPQLLENRRNQSGEAVSLSFTLIRFASDISNLIGGLLAHILPGMILVGVEYCVSDILLVSQVLYYGIRNRRIEGKPPLTATVEAFKGHLEPVDDDCLGVLPDGTPQNNGHVERSPLLRQHTHSGARKHYHALEDPVDHLTEILDEGGAQSTTHIWLKDLAFVLTVCIIGIVGWLVAYRFGVWTPAPEEIEALSNKSSDMIQGTAQILGYASAVLSLSCRIPQILKNWRKKSCEGLSLLFFLLSLIGNLTYGAGILFHSTQRDYVMTNMPWLVGSLGTMAQDVLIFVQFHMYRQPSK